MEWVKRLFTTKDGKIIIGQWPNFPLWIWVVFTILGFIPGLELYQEQFRIISSWGLAIWAYLEITEGVNTFRKILGTAVMIYMLVRVVITML